MNANDEFMMDEKNAMTIVKRYTFQGINACNALYVMDFYHREMPPTSVIDSYREPGEHSCPCPETQEPADKRKTSCTYRNHTGKGDQ